LNFNRFGATNASSIFVANNIMAGAGPRLVPFCDLVTGFCSAAWNKKQGENQRWR
jgi:hypothetical protein